VCLVGKALGTQPRDTPFRIDPHRPMALRERLHNERGVGPPNRVRTCQLPKVHIGEDVPVPHDDVALPERCGRASDPACRSQELFLLRNDDCFPSACCKGLDVVHAMVRVDDHPRGAGRVQPIQDVSEGRTIAHRKERFGTSVAERPHARPMASGKHHRGEHMESVPAKVGARSRTVVGIHAMPSARLVSVTLAALSLAAIACGTDAVGIQACRQIQEARCRQAPACNIPLEPPYRTSGSDVDACIRFYNDACLHGLASASDPGPIAVNACVAAINRAPTTDGGCLIVTTPQTADACSWLTPPAAPAADAASE
jgi:hypothetical protein